MLSREFLVQEKQISHNALAFLEEMDKGVCSFFFCCCPGKFQKLKIMLESKPPPSLPPFSQCRIHTMQFSLGSWDPGDRFPSAWRWKACICSPLRKKWRGGEGGRAKSKRKRRWGMRRKGYDFQAEWMIRPHLSVRSPFSFGWFHPWPVRTVVVFSS